jgi:ketosteroid isomerase-like protein
MSRENVELVRSIYAAWERGDFSSTDWAHPEIVFESFGFDSVRTTGVRAMGRWWRDWMSVWEGYRATADEFRELDDGRVVVLMRHGGRGKTSGVEVEDMMKSGVNVFDIRDGTVVRLALYWDREHALADLGLVPDDRK